jgi:hypothetical protein
MGSPVQDGGVIAAGLALVFDFDGVIIDSMPVRLQSSWSATSACQKR